MALSSSLASLALVLSAPLALGFVDRTCRSAVTVQFPRNDAIETSLFRPYRQSTSATSHPGGTATAIASTPDEKGDGDGWFDDYDDFVSNLDFGSGEWDRGADAPFEGGGDGSSSYGGGRGRGGRGRGRGGGRGGGYGGGERRESFNSYGGGHDYVRDASDTTSVDVEAVNRLMADRLHYRKKRMFDLADGIRDELQNAHGVTVWDKERTWSADSRGGRPDSRGRGGRGGRGGGRGGRGSGRGRGRERQFNEHGHDYSQAGGPVNPDVCTLPESEIHDLIRTRMECKFARDYVQADDIEATLSRAGVEVHDGFKEWRADGDAWSRSNRNDRESPRGPKEYTQRGVGLGLTEEQIETVTDLVRERSEAKADYDYPLADSIFDRLRTEFNVNVDDRAGQWAVLSEEYVMSEETAFVPEKSVQAEIGKMLGERVLARKRRDFDLADDIREKLLTDYIVEIDDQRKEWMVVSPPDGAHWNGEDDDGDVNVVSKEEWEADDDDDDDDDDVVDGDIDAVFEDPAGDDETPPEEEDEVDSPSNDNNLDEAQLASMTVPQLKEKLKEAGKPVSGRKSELIERLLS